MFDTAIIEISEKDFRIVNPSVFSKHPAELRGAFDKCYCNITSAEKRSGIYRPSVEIIRRGYSNVLRLEFSAPKMIYKNSLDELTEDDYILFGKQVAKSLEKIVSVDGSSVLQAPVCAFHPSKNIMLSDGYTVTFVIKEIYKANVDRRFDLNKADFRNNGQSLQVYTNSNSLVLYDKISDINKPHGRAIDKENTVEQKTIFESFNKKRIVPNVFRVEVRFGNKKAMKKMLSELGYKDDPTFEDLFNAKMNMDIVRYYQGRFFSIDKNGFIFDRDSDLSGVLRKLQRMSPRATPDRLLSRVGLYALARDDEGIRGLREQLPSSQWRSIQRKLKVFEDPKFHQNPHGFVKDIDDQLRDYRPIRAGDIID